MKNKKQTTRLYLIRHGETDWNKLGKVQGRIDRPLSQLGYLQAKSLGQFFADISLSALISSPLKRAVQTAEEIQKYHNLEISIRHALLEGNYGSLEGIQREVFLEEYAPVLSQLKKMARYERLHHKMISDAESHFEIASRAIPALEEITKEHLGGEVAIVTHGWLMRALLVVLAYFDDRSISITNGAILQIEGSLDRLEITGFQGISQTPSEWIFSGDHR